MISSICQIAPYGRQKAWPTHSYSMRVERWPVDRPYYILFDQRSFAFQLRAFIEGYVQGCTSAQRSYHYPWTLIAQAAKSD